MRARASLLYATIALVTTSAARTWACEPFDPPEPILESGQRDAGVSHVVAPRDGVWLIAGLRAGAAVELRDDSGAVVNTPVVEQVGPATFIVHVPASAVVGVEYTLAGFSDLPKVAVVEGSVAELDAPTLEKPTITHDFFDTVDGCAVGPRNVTSHDRAVIHFATNTEADANNTVLDAWAIESDVDLAADNQARALESFPLDAQTFNPNELVANGVLVLTAEAIGTYDVVARLRDVRTGVASPTQRATVTLAGDAYGGCSGFGFGCAAAGAPSPLLMLLACLALVRARSRRFAPVGIRRATRGHRAGTPSSGACVPCART